LGLQAGWGRLKIWNWIAFVVMLAGFMYATAQEQQKPAVDPQRTEFQIHEAGKEASFPELLPADLSSVITDKCGYEATGEIELSFIVDSEGHPHNVIMMRAVGSDLDKLAMVLAKGNRFKPAMLNGSPVAVVLTDTVKLTGCVATEKDEAGHESNHLRLRSQPEQLLKATKNAPKKAVFFLGKLDPAHIKDTVAAPVPILTFPPQFSEEARKSGATGECMIQIVVDAEGFPTNARVVRPLGSGLDEKAIEAIMRYRFKPGMREGIPMPVYMTIAVNFVR
jgi:TonB family protein